MTVSAPEPIELKQEEILSSDPAQLYAGLHPSTKRTYLERVSKMAQECGLKEAEICQAAVRLASAHDVDAAKERRLRSHVGYYLLEPAGIDELRRHLGKPPRPNRFTYGSKRLKGIVWLYVLASSALCALFGWLFIRPGDPIALSIVLVPCLFLIAASTVRSWMAAGFSHSRRPRLLPELDFRAGVTEGYKTVVAVPALLFDEGHGTELIQVLEAHWNEIKDPNVVVALLSDLPDCDRQAATEEERALVDFCARAMAELNEKPEYRDAKPFFLLHRDHQFCKTQGRWMGWERKRGKLHQLFALIDSGENAFTKTVGDLSRLRGAKYVIVLDEDTRLEPETVHRMIGAHAHPLNHPHLGDDGRRVDRGYGILQPWISNYKNEGAGDPMRPRREFFQDAFERTSYWGKGSINVSAYQSVVSDAIPEDCVLSHDCVESCLLPSGALVDVTVVEPLPNGHVATCLRRHRWLRGDWQNVRFLVESIGGREVSAFGKIHIVDLLMIAALPIGSALVIFRGFEAVHWGLLVLILVTGSPMYLEGLWMAAAYAAKRRYRAAKRTLLNVCGIPVLVLLLIENAGHRATISADALVRTVYRMARGRRLLEWQTATFTQERRRKLNICRIYQMLEAVGFGMAGILVWVLTGNIPAAVLLLVWAVHPSIVFLARTPHA